MAFIEGLDALGGANPKQAGQPADFRENLAPPIDKSDFFTGQASFVDEERWNKQYPYQLAIVRKEENGYKIENKWIFTLPIPPENLLVSTPFAISTSVTLGGIIEQHNGVPLKTISFSGTMGVFPTRGSGDGQSSPLGTILSQVQPIFAGTIQAAGATATNAIATITGSPPPNPNLYDDSLDPSIGGLPPKSTGYYQFLTLKSFLENYAVMKKSIENRDLHLVLMIWKEKTAYFVTPVRFDANKSKDSPHEFRYNLQFTAWKAIDPNLIDKTGVASIQTGGTKAKSPGILNQVLNRIQYARKTLQSARKTILAVKPDFDASVGEVLRQTVLCIKDAISVQKTANDFEASTIDSIKDSVVTQWDRVKSAVSKTDKEVSKAFNAIDESSKNLASGSRSSFEATSPVAKIFQNPNDNFKLFNEIKIDSLTLPAHIVKQMAAQKEAVRALTKRDFQKKRKALIDFAADYAAKVGISTPTYTKTYGRSTLPSLREATDEDYKILGALNESIMQLSKMIATADNDLNTNVISTVEAIAGFAEKSGVAFKVPTSKFLVPMPYGITLEQLAARYLKDPNRWHEIAALNGLRSPYIDEAGFTLDILTNVVNKVATVSDASNLFLGQNVILYSTSVGQTKARIARIDKINDSYFAIKLDSSSDLSDYTVAEESKLLAYLPGTINSQQLIYIPSDRVSTIDPQLQAIPGVNDQDNLLNVGGIDLLLTPTGDLVITDDGDARLAFGLTNIVQYVKLTIGTPRGSLIYHPDFGFAPTAGTSLADFDAKGVLQSIKALFDNDPTFTGIKAASVNINGPAMDISIALGVAGSEQLVPISFTVLK